MASVDKKGVDDAYQSVSILGACAVFAALLSLGMAMASIYRGAIIVIGSKVVMGAFAWLSIVFAAIGFLLWRRAAVRQQDTPDGCVTCFTSGAVYCTLAIAVFVSLFLGMHSPKEVLVGAPDANGNRTVKIVESKWGGTETTLYKLGPNSIIAHYSQKQRIP